MGGAALICFLWAFSAELICWLARGRKAFIFSNVFFGGSFAVVVDLLFSFGQLAQFMIDSYISGQGDSIFLKLQVADAGTISEWFGASAIHSLPPSLISLTILRAYPRGTIFNIINSSAGAFAGIGISFLVTFWHRNYGGNISLSILLAIVGCFLTVSTGLFVTYLLQSVPWWNVHSFGSFSGRSIAMTALAVTIQLCVPWATYLFAIYRLQKPIEITFSDWRYGMITGAYSDFIVSDFMGKNYYFQPLVDFSSSAILEESSDVLHNPAGTHRSLVGLTLQSIYHPNSNGTTYRVFPGEPPIEFRDSNRLSAQKYSTITILPFIDCTVGDIKNLSQSPLYRRREFAPHTLTTLSFSARRIWATALVRSGTKVGIMMPAWHNNWIHFGRSASETIVNSQDPVPQSVRSMISSEAPLTLAVIMEPENADFGEVNVGGATTSMTPVICRKSHEKKIYIRQLGPLDIDKKSDVLLRGILVRITSGGDNSKDGPIMNVATFYDRDKTPEILETLIRSQNNTDYLMGTISDVDGGVVSIENEDPMDGNRTATYSGNFGEVKLEGREFKDVFVSGSHLEIRPTPGDAKGAVIKGIGYDFSDESRRIYFTLFGELPPHLREAFWLGLGSLFIGYILLLCRTFFRNPNIGPFCTTGPAEKPAA